LSGGVRAALDIGSSIGHLAESSDASLPPATWE
jgi:hypothetical protein